MRTLLTGSLFALAVLVAACGGGGKSSVLPNAANPGSANQPPATKTANATIVLNIPPPSRQASRRPFYVSPGTQSLGALAVLATSTETPSPTNLTIYPVATPSPCAAASGGGYTCTLTVSAPIGTDNFFVAAFATASPNAHAVPLSEYIATGIVVSASPAPGATPLTFTLDGVVYSVVITVPSADPAGSNTQLFPAGVAASPLPLGVTAYDSSNSPILTNVTDTFANPIAITVSPAGEGISLSLSGATCSSGGGAAVAIGCAADLNHVDFAYDGTTTPDPNDHVVDTYTIASSTQQGNPTPSPATVKLASNILTWTVGSGSFDIDGGTYLQRSPSGPFVYLVQGGEGNYIGTFTPSPQLSVPQPSTLNGVSSIFGFAIAPTGGALWIVDNGNIDCFNSVASAMAGPTPAPAGLQAYNPAEDQLELVAITVDGANNVWYVGVDNNEDSEYYRDVFAGDFAAPSGCSSAPGTAMANTLLQGDSDDYEPQVAPYANGMAVVSDGETGSNGLYVVPTGSPASASVISAVLGGPAGTGAAVDGSGTTYATFEDEGGDVESMASGGTMLSRLLTLPPTSQSGGDYQTEPFSLAAFSPTNTAADRLMYLDNDYVALGLVENVPASPMPILAGIPDAGEMESNAYSAKGAEYLLYQDANQTLDLARVIPTTTWSVPSTMPPADCNVSGLLTILERGDSEPFTVTFGTGASGNALAGDVHNYWFNSGGAPFTVTVSAAGRTENYTMSNPQSAFYCGINHRPLHGRRTIKPPVR
jgi:hypothetical protein